MPALHENWRALSIQQPWVDLILDGRKTVEVRWWRAFPERGGFLIHAAERPDWKTVELLGYKNALALPRKQFIGYAAIVDVVRLDDANRLDGLFEHWVIHPFLGQPFGARLADVRRFKTPIAGGGGRRFFSPAPALHAAIARQLVLVGIDPQSNPGDHVR